MHKRLLEIGLLKTTLWATSIPVSSSVQGTDAPAAARFDLTRADEARKWRPVHDVAAAEPTPQGLRVRITGEDPYIQGPARDYPPGQPLWLRMRIRSDEGGMAQVFYFTAAPREEDSVRFAVSARTWVDARLPLPPLGKNTKFRFDPPGGGGDCLIESIVIEPRNRIQEPHWPSPSAPTLKDSLLVTAGELQLRQDRKRFGSFELNVAGESMARGNDRPLIGYQINGDVRWVDVEKTCQMTTRRIQRNHGLEVTAHFSDQDGADWEIAQRFEPDDSGSALNVQTRVLVTRDRSVVNLPMLTLFPGLGSFGDGKGQGIFCGLEYLDEEPSSSNKDLEGPEHVRRVPDTLKITLPLMAVQARGRYVGLMWEPSNEFSALFDSPDRVFGSGAHVMGILFPGSNGSDREDGALLPYQGTLIRAGQPLELRATLIGGKAASVIPAVQKYVQLRGLPPVPSAGIDLPSYVRQASAGWLDSKITEGGLYRHAWPGGFVPGRAADAAVFMDWLASVTEDTALRKRLSDQAAAALAQVGSADYYGSGVSHVRFPVAPLLYGGLAENTEKARELASSLLDRFEPDGSVRYRPTAGGLDYGRTHDAKDANGLTAQVVATLLQAAAFCGDRDLIARGIERLRGLNRYSNTVPRGAQTWEIPLHTPDILASGYLTRAYTLGYELTGDQGFLEQARYWAWTGVPFVYLIPPTREPIGLYGTIPVLGATQWKAPVWMGLPVQWCGLVYADALYQLMPHDPQGPWKRLADGITASGILQSWPTDGADQRAADRRGLLPDSFSLRAQSRNDAAINPGTLEACAIRLLGRPNLYGFRVFRQSGVLVHAAGEITDAVEEQDGIGFTVRGWATSQTRVVLLHLPGRPKALIDGKELPESLQEYDVKEGRLVLTITGSPEVKVRWR